MSNVKVWNDNVYPFKQEFKGKMIEIGPKKYIDMDYEEAIEFKSLYYPPEFDSALNQKPTSYKMIRIEGSPTEQNDVFICHMCKDKFLTQDELDNHIDKHHLDDLIDKDEAAKRKARKKVQ